MAVKKSSIKKVTSWSFSRYSDYKLCPLKFKLKHIDKITEPKNDAMQRGADVHEKAEKYIKGEIRTLPAELKLFADKFKELRKVYKKVTSGLVVEDNWAFTIDWTRTMWNDWIGCWVRIKLDCAEFEDTETMIINDWKTGKFRADQNEEYVEQLELYGLAALLLHPHVETVKPRLVYLDTGEIYPPEDKPIIFTRKDIPKLKKLWEKRVKPMMNDLIFPPRPNDKCRWCHFRKSSTGHCKF